MGTAIVGVAASINPGPVESLVQFARTLSQVMTILTVVLVPFILVPHVGRIFFHSDAAIAHLRNPAVGALHGTLLGGILVVSAAMVTLGPTWFAPSSVRDIVATLDWVRMRLTFPLGAFAVSALALSQSWDLTNFQRIAAALLVLLSIFWLVVVARTIRELVVGELIHVSRPSSTKHVTNN